MLQEWLTFSSSFFFKKTNRCSFPCTAWSLNANVADVNLLLLPFSFFFGLVLKSSKRLRHCLCLWTLPLFLFSMLNFVKSILIELPRSCSFLSVLTVSDYFIDQILTLSVKRGCVMYRLIAMWESFSSSKVKLISSQLLPKGKKYENLEVLCQGTETLWQLWPDMTILLQPSCLMANTMTKKEMQNN